ncbi:hypothetical protein K503DRAFT_560431 [Rhizopogon vinicolor AM-OR11-026]|uniref:TOG domain-containing protein n=1 Tax=Rhizopogon vinicolor AM-OR11-026 TaxID=1314800 RepID=A0A1B7MK86_9AGAM|nr:hypothetical protein K503DRAFT_560431 [Rhizopogon vinicolor AM-OR11-026]
MCSSSSALKAQLEVVRRKVSLQETGASWNTIEEGILDLTKISNHGACKFTTEVVAGIHSLSKPLNNALNSERSRLSGSAIVLVTSLSAGLGSAFEPLVSIFLPTLLGLCARTNKVFTSRAKACIFAVIENTQLPSILPYLAKSANHKSTNLRLLAAEGVLTCLNSFILRDDTHVRLLKDVIISTAQDASADVRATGKMVLETYKALSPDSEESFITPKTAVSKTRLELLDTAAEGSKFLNLRHTTTEGVTLLESSVPPSALRAPSELGSLSTNGPRDAAHPLAPTTKRPQQKVLVKPRNEKSQVGEGTQRALVPITHLQETDGTEVVQTIEKIYLPSAKQNSVGSKPRIAKCHPSNNHVPTKIHSVASASTANGGPSFRTGPEPSAKDPTARATRSRIARWRPHGPPTMAVDLQMASLQASRRRVDATRSCEQVVGQEKPMLGGRPLTEDPKPIVKVLSVDSCKPVPEGVSSPVVHPTAVPLPSSPVSTPYQSRQLQVEPAVSGEPPGVQATTHGMPVSLLCNEAMPTSCDVHIQGSSFNTPLTDLSCMELSEMLFTPSSHDVHDATRSCQCINATPSLCNVDIQHSPSKTPLAAVLSLVQQRGFLCTPSSCDTYAPQDMSRACVGTTPLPCINIQGFRSKTPIASLHPSIECGFLCSPSVPLSPPRLAQL